MGSYLSNMEGLLKQINESIAKMQQKAHYHDIGYSTKCKTCNDPQLEDIERLYNEGYTYQQIIDTLQLEDISIMALSRHFKNHYPKSQEYKAKQRQLALERLTHALKKWPFLEQYFMQQNDDFIRDFSKVNGFCIDKMGLCQYIAPGYVSSCQNITGITKDIMDRKLNKAYSSQKQGIWIDANDDIINCLRCKDQINEQRMDLMELFICKEILGVDHTNKELYASWLQTSIDKQTFVNEMIQAKEQLDK